MSESNKSAGGAPTRNYVCLEEQVFEGGEVDYDEARNLPHDTTYLTGTYYVIAGIVEARNATNAMRKAYREFKGAEESEAVMVVIPEGMWRPTAVRGTRRPDITVSIG